MKIAEPGMILAAAFVFAFLVSTVILMQHDRWQLRREIRRRDAEIRRLRVELRDARGVTQALASSRGGPIPPYRSPR